MLHFLRRLVVPLGLIEGRFVRVEVGVLAIVLIVWASLVECVVVPVGVGELILRGLFILLRANWEREYLVELPLLLNVLWLGHRLLIELFLLLKQIVLLAALELGLVLLYLLLLVVLELLLLRRVSKEIRTLVLPGFAVLLRVYIVLNIGASHLIGFVECTADVLKKAA